MSLSEQLKDGTAAAHAAAESVLFVKNFIQGNIPLDLYKRLLAGLFHAYTAMERRLAEEAAADEGGIVDQVHFPVELNRVNSLAADLEHWLGAGWRDAPELEMSQCTREYVRRLEKATPAGLVAHAYTRYMGDLSGGQILMRKARKAFGMDHREQTAGLSFYIFEQVPRANKFKEQYRVALDGLLPAPPLAAEIVAEANVAFLMNMRIFAELDVLSGAKEAASIPPLSAAVEELVAAARKEEEEAAARAKRGEAPKKMECPFANLGRYLEKVDFGILLRLHASEGEGEAFEEDVARIEREKKEAAAAGGTASHGSSAQPQSGSGSNYFVLVAAVVLALSSCAWLLMHQSELVV